MSRSGIPEQVVSFISAPNTAVDLTLDLGTIDKDVPVIIIITPSGAPAATVTCILTDPDTGVNLMQSNLQFASGVAGAHGVFILSINGAFAATIATANPPVLYRPASSERLSQKLRIQVGAIGVALTSTVTVWAEFLF